MSNVQKLKDLSLFQDLPTSALENVAAGMDEKNFSAGDVIIKEGEKSGALYVVASGTVAIQKKLDAAGEKTKVVARLSAGEFFGEMSLLENQVHSASVIAETAVGVFILPRQSLDQLIKKDAPAAVDHVLSLLAGISSRLRQTTKELVTVFEVARLMGREAPLNENLVEVLRQLQVALGETVKVGFYRWNFFNDEYEHVVSGGGQESSNLPSIIDKSAHLSDRVDLLISRVDHLKNREGLFVYQSAKGFDAAARQLIDTIASMLAPTLATARVREEEAAKVRLERNKQKERFHY